MPADVHAVRPAVPDEASPFRPVQAATEVPRLRREKLVTLINKGT
jgi:hypothetical protein